MKILKFLEITTNQDSKTCEAMLKSKRIKVNDTTITNPKTVVKETKDQIFLDGQKLIYEEYVYLMMNKPPGVVSATSDNFQKTVLDDILDYQKRDLKIVGRLDKDTEGLLLITDDGAFIHHLTSPKHNISKTYLVHFSGVCPGNIQERFEKGIILEDGYKCLPASFELLSANKSLIKIQEGKFHQVKRMCMACGMKVEYLKRLSIGNVLLDDTLNLGEYRKLTEEELAELKK